MGLYEGNYFSNDPTIVGSFTSGSLFSSESAYLSKCSTYLGRSCVANAYSSSGSFNYADTGFFSEFSGHAIASAASASSIESSVVSDAGNQL
jgi:pectin lyase